MASNTANINNNTAGSNNEDYVVEEISIYLSPKPDQVDKVYIVQYPTKSMVSKEMFNHHLSSRFKREKDFLLQEFSLDQEENTYSKQKGNLFAKNDANSNEENKSVNTQTFQSSPIDPQGSLVFGILESNKNYSSIYLTPVDKILQMRPAFKYLDSADCLVQDDQSNGEQKLTKVGVKVSRIQKKEESSQKLLYRNYQTNFRKIPWTEGIFFNPNTEASRKFLNYFSRNNTTKWLNAVDKPVDEYIKQLVSFEIPTLKSNGEDAGDQSGGSLDDQIKNLMLKVNISHFSGIIDILPKKFDHESILKSLKRFCCLVNGVWVIKSSILYDGYVNEENSSITAKKVITARDYLLMKINKDKFINRKDYSIHVKLPSSSINMIMNPICKNNPSVGGWTLKLQDDTFFINSHQDEVKLQNLFWEARSSQIMTELSSSLNDLSIPEVRNKKFYSFDTLEKLMADQKVLLSSEINDFLLFKNIALQQIDIQEFLEQNHCLLISKSWKNDYSLQEDIYIHYDKRLDDEDLLTIINLLAISPTISQNLLKSTSTEALDRFLSIVKTYCTTSNGQDYCLRKLKK